MTFISTVMVADTEAQVRAGQFSVNPASETAMIDADTAPVTELLPKLAGEGGRAQIVAWSYDQIEIEVESVQPGDRHPA